MVEIMIYENKKRGAVNESTIKKSNQKNIIINIDNLYEFTKLSVGYFKYSAINNCIYKYLCEFIDNNQENNFRISIPNEIKNFVKILLEEFRSCKIFSDNSKNENIKIDIICPKFISDNRIKIYIPLTKMNYIFRNEMYLQTIIRELTNYIYKLNINPNVIYP